jgi:hypothetical protein
MVLQQKLSGKVLFLFQLKLLRNFLVFEDLSLEVVGGGLRLLLLSFVLLVVCGEIYKKLLRLSDTETVESFAKGKVLVVT